MLTHHNPAPIPPSRVVVLGARGFISRHLQAWCARNGFPCAAVGKEQLDLSRAQNAVDLAHLLRAEDAVVMTSMLTPDRGRDSSALMTNLRMAETVCGALRQTGCRQLIYLSSDAVYDAAKIPLDEDSSREPVDLYALSHTAREMMLGAELGKAATPVCILRLTSVYGPGDTHNAYGPNRFVRAALGGHPIQLFGRGEERRSHVYINDVIQLIALALSHRSAGTLNVADRPAVSFADIAQKVIHLSGAAVPVEYLPRTVPTVHHPYKPTQVFRFIYNLGRPIGPIVHRTFVNSALFAAFPGFRFTPLERGISEFIAAERGTGPAAVPETRDVVITSAPRE